MAKENTKKIHSVLIIDVLGSPKEFLNETLQNMIDSIGKEKGVTIVEGKINEPKEIEDKKGFFSNFAEIELTTEDLSTLSMLMFKYMPAHIEVIYPEDLNVKNHILNEVLNELVRRLHGYENLARVFQYEKGKLTEEIQRLQADKNIEEDTKKKTKKSTKKS